MRDFVIVHMLEPYELNKSFSIWGFHMTVMQWFEAPSPEAVEKLIRPIVECYTVMKIEVGELLQFGSKNTHLVSVLPKLRSLHEEILAAIEGAGWTIHGRYTGPLFRPHITTKLGKEYEPASFLMDKLQITESLPPNYRRIVAEIELQ